MTAISACLVPILLLVLLLCPACTTSTQRTAMAVSLCLASYSADTAISVVSGG